VSERERVRNTVKSRLVNQGRYSKQRDLDLSNWITTGAAGLIYVLVSSYWRIISEWL
jgi:hypothetical protein